MAKRYVYVDETGQDTRGALFIVAAIVLAETEQVCDACERIEAATGKAISKWGKTRPAIRVAYMKKILRLAMLTGRLYVAVYENRSDHHPMTIETLADVLGKERVPGMKTRVYVDGLSKQKSKEYAQKLRQNGIQTNAIRTVEKDENSVLIRLADSLAGFVRDALGNANSEERRMYDQALSQGKIIRVK